MTRRLMLAAVVVVGVAGVSRTLTGARAFQANGPRITGGTGIL